MIVEGYRLLFPVMYSFSVSLSAKLLIMPHIITHGVIMAIIFSKCQCFWVLFALFAGSDQAKLLISNFNHSPNSHFEALNRHFQALKWAYTTLAIPSVHS